MIKNIKDLSEDEAIQILEFVYSNNEYSFTKISFDRKITKDGEQITFNGRSIIGIEYHNGQDNCILHFDNSKAILWLYKNGYDITEQLEENSYFSEMEKDFENFSFNIYWLVDKRNHIKKNKIHLYTLDYVLDELKKYNDKYYYKNYD